jgi:Zn-dependent protease
MNRLRSHSGRCDDGGAVAVEFAFIFPVAIAILGFAIAAGLYVFWSAMAGDVARDTARYASLPVGSNYHSHGDLVEHAEGELGGVLGTPQISTDGSDVRGKSVTVTLTYNVPGVTGMLGLVNAIPGVNLDGLEQVTRSATVRRE